MTNQSISHGLVIRQRRTTRRTRPEQVPSAGNVAHTCDTRDTEQEDATTSQIVEQHHINVSPTQPPHFTTTPSTFGPVESRSWVLRLFSTRRNFPRAAQFFFVCELSGRTNRKKTKKNCAARGKFRLVENSL